jgi:hypothetical protein
VWPFWRPNPFDLAHGHAFDADFAEGVLHFFEFERFDDRFNFLHINRTLQWENSTHVCESVGALIKAGRD